MSEQPGPVPEKPARYDRTFRGLLAAMVATVVIVVGFVAFRGAFRDNPEAEITPVDYLSAVGDLQGADTTVVYPSSLPDGWVATSIAFERGVTPSWRIGMLDGRGKDPGFVGVVQRTDDVEDLLDEFVDASPEQGEDATPANGIGATTWQTWADDGGDRAFSTTLDSGPLAGQTVLVYGSAPAGELEELVGLLTTGPVAD